MTEQTTVWDNLPEESEGYIKFTDENGFKVSVRFIDNDPHEVPSTFTKDKMNYEFEVIDLNDPDVVKPWTISSVKLMRTLRMLRPLAGRAFEITRTGEGMKIDYVVAPIQ